MTNAMDPSASPTRPELISLTVNGHPVTIGGTRSVLPA